MSKVNMMQLREPEDFTRSDLQQWCAQIRTEVLNLIRAEYADSPYRWIAPLDDKWIDNALHDGLSDATSDAWNKLED